MPRRHAGRARAIHAAMLHKRWGRAPGATEQAEASNRLLVLRSRGVVLSELGKGGAARPRQVRATEPNANEPLKKCRKPERWCQNRGSTLLPGGVREATCQLPGRRPACRRRERSPGSCVERGNLRGDGKGQP